MAPPKSLKILLVEDNDDHAELVLRSMSDHHVENSIDRVCDGEEALTFLSGDQTPDLILLDLRLPKLDGLEVLRHIKTSETLCHIPVVILTTSEAETDVAKAYELQANAYVVKPVDYETFVKLMRDLGFFWLAWNRRPSTGEGL